MMRNATELQHQTRTRSLPTPSLDMTMSKSRSRGYKATCGIAIPSTSLAPPTSISFFPHMSKSPYPSIFHLANLIIATASYTVVHAFASSGRYIDNEIVMRAQQHRGTHAKQNMPCDAKRPSQRNLRTIWNHNKSWGRSFLHFVIFNRSLRFSGERVGVPETGRESAPCMPANLSHTLNLCV
jgi:hypothetical protein